ncbi:AMP-binding protein [Micromonospora inositola]|uniref:Acyl-CoA synthetase (AMP-forming)/AMP-acid ligase II n=1 Tax=Micromonospora inositola TaxID=47865 RepID=A0A1C5JNE7_9ACTN|nr:AMP-binding protein [Micromonospora inositola]SCG72003.1 Acyl-CoA synthetase (AMP-forming)/AMP-acid ligase II [Micromonospora inositola]
MSLDAFAMNLIQRVNVADILRRSARQHRHKPALVSGQESVTYAQLDADVDRVARALQARGVGRGDHVALMFRNSVDFFRVYFANARIGAVSVPLNPSLTLAEYTHILTKTRPRLLLAHGGLAEVAGRITGAHPGLPVVLVPGGGGEDAEALQAESWAGFLDAGAADDGVAGSVDAFVEDRDPVQVIFTSGTTSAAKGAVASHLAAVFAATSVVAHQRLTEHDVCLAIFPNHHVAGLNNSVVPYLMVGATTVLRDGWNAAAVAEAIERHSVTMMISTGPMLLELVDRHGGQFDWSTLRLVILGMASVPADRAAVVRKLCPDVELLLASGQTEFTGYEEAMRREDQATKADSWGNPTLFTDVGIMDDSGRLLPPREVGEIVYRGPQSMNAYLDEPEQTAASFEHGWFHSGDLGYLDEENTVYFVDRKKDMIKTGGENVASVEVAQAILKLDAVAECTVVGLPHERWTEAVTAFVKLREGPTLEEGDVIAHCRSELAPFKVPKRVLFVEEFPRTATHKIRNVELRKAYADLYLAANGQQST